MKVFKNLYAYRELLKSSVKKDIGGKYKNSFLGILWSFVNPLLQIAVYAIVFPLIMRNNQEHYTLFLWFDSLDVFRNSHNKVIIYNDRKWKYN